MADGLDAVERLELLLAGAALVLGFVEVAENELDGLEQAAGGLRLPDLTEAAAAQAFEEPEPGMGSARLSIRTVMNRSWAEVGGVRFWGKLVRKTSRRRAQGSGPNAGVPAAPHVHPQP